MLRIFKVVVLYHNLIWNTIGSVRASQKTFHQPPLLAATIPLLNAQSAVLQCFRGVRPLQVPMYALEVRRANSRINVDLPMRRLPRQATRELVAFRQSDSRSSRYSRRPIKRTEFGISIFCFSNILRIISLLSQHSNVEYHEISDFIIS